jgi:hypothetical protein
MGEKTTEILNVGGRQFELAHDVTFEHHIWMMNHAYQAGLHEPAVTPEVQLGRLLACGRIPQLLAGALLEVGVPWTAEGADKNAEFFRTLRAPSDIAALDAVLTAVIANFFPSTGSLSTTSPSSSIPADDETAGAEESEAASTLATGPSSSESSPGTTKTESGSS